MKNSFVIFALSLFAAALSVTGQATTGATKQATAEAATSRVIQYGIYQPETINDYRAVQLHNGFNNYVVKLVQTKAMGNQPGKFEIRLREPTVYYSFSRPIDDFIRIKVGTIQLITLEPDLKDLQIWQRDGKAGFDMPFNFDGKKFTLTLYLREDSPVLWGRWQGASDVNVPVEISFNLVVSGFDPSKFEGVYERRADTSSRVIEMNSSPQPLTPADSRLIFFDEKFQPGKLPNKNSVGPCFLTWQWNTVETAQLWLNNYYHTSVTVQLKPESPNFNFGLCESKTARTNAEFMDYFKTNQAGFEQK